MRDKLVQSNMPDYKVVDKFIYYRTSFENSENSDEDVWKLYVPTGLRKGVMYSAHDSPTSAHGGVGKTLESIRRHFYWPGMATEIRKYVLSCDLCKTSKAPTYALRTPMGQMVETERPFQRIYVDLIGPFPRTRKGNTGILIVLDHFSKFTFLKPLRKFTSTLIIEFLKANIFDCFGVPETAVSDNGSQFTSKEFTNFLTKYGIRHTRTAVYSPQSNASERVNRSINEALRSFVRKDQRSWDLYISSINSALRNGLHQSVGESPYHIVFGQNITTHGSDYGLLRNLGLLAEGSAKLTREDEFAIIREAINAKLKQACDKNVRSYNLRARKGEFQVGQEVVRRNFAQSNLQKHLTQNLPREALKLRL